jgi:murein DD-endopeptidase MepM/ murein hydrolase activator NlpD
VRQLGYRDVVEALEVGGVDVWLRVGENEWCAVKVGSTVYCEPGEPPVIPTHPTGFVSPVGTDEERASGVIWPGLWKDVNPYLTAYSMGYHPGADLNLNIPDKPGKPGQWNADKGMPVHSIGDGIVTHAGVLPKTWGNVVVVRHIPLSDGTPVYSRYAHLASIAVSAGDQVSRGQVIGTIGTMPGWPGYEHLDFAISCTDILEAEPGHWPGGGQAGKDAVKANYVDPKRFLQTYRRADKCD